MNQKVKNAAILWTGGKDCALALYEATQAGYEVGRLVTFVPKNPKFLAHPLDFIKRQAQCIGLPHYTIEIEQPIKENCERAIDDLKKSLRINTLITGDISEVDGFPNWIRGCSHYSGMNIYTPLWGRDRNELISKLLSLKFKVIFSCVKKPWFESDWVGKVLDENCWRELQKKNEENGLDVCGENGEYHTMVLDAPYFERKIDLANYSVDEKESLMFMGNYELTLDGK